MIKAKYDCHIFFPETANTVGQIQFILYTTEGCK